MQKENTLNTKWQSKTSNIRSACADEKGIVLIAAIALVAILALVGTVAVITTNTDIKISDNYKTSVKALYAAQAGSDETKARLSGPSSAASYAGDPALNPDENWSAYILTSNTWQTSDDPNYNNIYKNYIPKYSPVAHTNTVIVANSLQTGISYWVKIRHKREYDAEQAGHTTTSLHYYDNDGSTATHTAGAPGNIVFYGYEDPSAPTTAVQFTSNAPPAKYEPVEIITAYGSSGGSLKVIEIEVVHYPGPPIVAPLYSKYHVDINGSSATVDGNDNCSTNPSLPPAYVLSPPGDIEYNESHPPSFGGNPPLPQTGPIDVDIMGYINAMKNDATITITSDQTNGTYGNASNYVICYSDTSNPPNNQGLSLNGVTGYGILLVKGDLKLGGGFIWHGLILSTGDVQLDGGGSGVNIYGSILSVQTSTINGGINVYYNSCDIQDALENQPLKVIKWKEDY